jgi:hypothetical protein
MAVDLTSGQLGVSIIGITGITGVEAAHAGNIEEAPREPPFLFGLHRFADPLPESAAHHRNGTGARPIKAGWKKLHDGDIAPWRRSTRSVMIGLGKPRARHAAPAAARPV